MVTDDTLCFDVGNMTKLDNYTASYPMGHFSDRYSRNRQMEQGLLLNYIIEGLSISPETNFADIISFKNCHRDELGKFKVQLAKLTRSFSDDMPADAVRQEISDIYNNEFLPAFNDFKSALNGFRIKWFTETFLRVSTLSASATGIPMALLGMSVPQAVFAGLGASVVASIISYNAEKKQCLRKNPYSYLLSIKQEHI